MLIHPQFDPVAIHLGPLAVHWYGLMYLLGFMLFLWLGRQRIRLLNGRNNACSPDGTTSHSTRLPKGGNQVAGYLSRSPPQRTPLPNSLGETTSHSTKLQKSAAKSLVIPQAGEGANENDNFQFRGERDKGSLRESDFRSLNWDNKLLDDLLFYGVLGVVLGGRLGEVLFYHPGYYFSHPLEIFAVWRGGMSFHGGFLGVLGAMTLFARKQKIQWLQLMDFIAPLVPLGLGAGRIGNFINGELWGRPTDVPWGMVFPNVDNIPRHPSQLYEFALEGIALFILLWLYSNKPRPMGAVSGLFLIGYGSFRFLAEFTRNPDDGIFGLMTFGISMGQWLSLPMVLAGVAMMVWAEKAARE